MKYDITINTKLADRWYSQPEEDSNEEYTFTGLKADLIGTCVEYLNKKAVNLKQVEEALILALAVCKQAQEIDAKAKVKA